MTLYLLFIVGIISALEFPQIMYIASSLSLMLKTLLCNSNYTVHIWLDACVYYSGQWIPPILQGCYCFQYHRVFIRKCYSPQASLCNKVHYNCDHHSDYLHHQNNIPPHKCITWFRLKLDLKKLFLTTSTFFINSWFYPGINVNITL